MKIYDVINPVYQVGGSVRDAIMGREPKDLDYCTPLTPDEIELAIRKAGRKPYLVGKRFGTVGFKLDGKMVEVTTFRTEKYEKGNRKPTVSFVSNIHHDLSRRDFTINAIAVREPDNKVIDLFGGFEDIENRIVRAVGKPKERFTEDPLRILRAARFASQLGFSVDPGTEKYMAKCAPHLLDISKERWVSELDKILISDRPEIGIGLLVSVGAMKWMIPELQMQDGFEQNSQHHDFTLLEHTLMVLRDCPNDLNLRWAALFHDIGKPFTKTENKKGHSNYIHHELMGYEIVIRYSKYLKWSNARTKAVSELVRTHLEDANPLREFDNMHKRKGD